MHLWCYHLTTNQISDFIYPRRWATCHRYCSISWTNCHWCKKQQQPAKMPNEDAARTIEFCRYQQTTVLTCGSFSLNEQTTLIRLVEVTTRWGITSQGINYYDRGEGNDTLGETSHDPSFTWPSRALNGVNIGASSRVSHGTDAPGRWLCSR